MIFCVLTGGLAEYQNDWDGPLHVTCNTAQGEALYLVQSVYSKYKRDRRWMWQCKQIVPGAMRCDTWSKEYDYDQTFNFQCDPNYVLTGVQSVHSNKKEDRMWKFRCCKAEGHCTRPCSSSNYINNLGGYMHYRAPHIRVFTGVSSDNDNTKE